GSPSRRPSTRFHLSASTASRRWRWSVSARRTPPRRASTTKSGEDGSRATPVRPLPGRQMDSSNSSSSGRAEGCSESMSSATTPPSWSISGRRCSTTAGRSTTSSTAPSTRQPKARLTSTRPTTDCSAYRRWSPKREGEDLIMRKVILQMMMTIDGFVAGPNDEMDWIDNDPVMGQAHFALARDADAAIIGHTVYRGMAQFWPEAAANLDAPHNEAEFGKLMSDMHKIVVWTKPEDLEWTNCEQLIVTSDDDLVERFTELKNQSGEYLLLYGGVRTAQTFVRHNLVDEYRLDVCPTALAAGKPLFPDRTSVELVSATPYESGAMSVVYRSAG